MTAPAWLERFIHPSFFVFIMTSIIGGIVWGVQLNYSIMTMTENIGQLKIRTTAYDEISRETVQHLARVAYKLDTMDARLSKEEQRTDKHIDDAYAWRQKVIQIEERLKLHDK